MTLAEWLQKHRPGEGGKTWLMQEAKVSFPSVRKAYERRGVRQDVAEKISRATGGEVSIEELVIAHARAAHASTRPRASRRRAS